MSGVVPAHVMIAAQRHDGLVLGAYEDGRMVGVLFGFTALQGQRPYHYSHITGVVRDYQSRGVGYRLKLAQRRFVIGRGEDLVTWTFDPLQAANAYFNIGKLGGVCRTYLRNLYGVLDDSLNRGRVTDRFEVEWWVRSRRVTRRLETRQRPVTLQDIMSTGVPIVNETRLRKHVRTASGARLGATESRLLVEIPESIVKVREVSLGACREWTLNLRRVLEHYFARRYAVTDVIVEREDNERRVFYILESNFRP